MANKSPIGTWNWRDAGRGLLMAVLGAFLDALYQLTTAPEFDFSNIDWKLLLRGATIAAVSYLIKNLGTNSEGKILKKEPES